MKMSTQSKAFLAIIIAAALWGSAGSTSKTLFVESTPFVAASHRFLLASIIILPFFLRAKKPKGYILKLLPLGIFNAGNVLFYYSGLSHTTANTASIIGTAAPLTTLLLSWLLIKERIGKEKIVGILIGLLGALFIVLLPMIEKGNTATGSLYGNILLIISLASWTMYMVYSRYILSGGEYTPIVSTGINIFTVAGAAMLSAFLSSQNILSPALSHPTYLGTLLYAAIGITIVTFFLFQWAVQHMSASTASLKEYLQLIIGVGFNALILREQLTGAYLIGSLLVGLGVFIATGQRLSKKLASILFSQGE